MLSRQSGSRQVAQGNLSPVATLLERDASVSRSHRGPPAWVVPGAALIAVAGRLPFIGRAPTPDEAGYLLVGGQWNGAGSSLYGDYWVDRPPGLVTIFRLAADLGGVTALRILGCIAVLIIVLGVAQVARMVDGDRSARWAAVIAAALCLSPALGVQAVNGELLAGPFVVLGIVAAVSALQTPDRHAALACGAFTGALAVGAVMVKQNFVDVAVFEALALVLSGLRRSISPRRFADLTASFAVGAAMALGLLALWTTVHGTSLTAVFDAMYPFRVEAGHVIAASGSGHAWPRLAGLGAVAAGSGLLLLVLAVLIDAVRPRHRNVFAWALVGLLLFSSASVLLGGSYWHHYLIGLIVPVSIGGGLMAGSGGRVVRALVLFTVVSAVATCIGSLSLRPASEGQAVGSSIAGASRTEDTIVSLYGHADIVQTSGLASPYEHLWSLPIKTLDPQLTELDAVLDGPSAPTWLVTGRSVRSWGLDTHGVEATIAGRYQRVARMCGRTIYLLDGLDRATPTTTSTCGATSAARTHITELLP